MLKKISFDILKKYFSEFALIFISVVLAFALTEWSSNQGDKVSQKTILREINNGLKSDLIDLQNNYNGHKISVSSINYFANWSKGSVKRNDSLALHYLALFRNYSPIINKTGYESMKSSGLKTITNDSLRFKIIELYDFNYKIIEKLEDGAPELQDFQNYFKPINDVIYPNLIFSNQGQIVDIKPSDNLTEKNRQELLSYFWRMKNNRVLKILRYKEVLNKLKLLEKSIIQELKNLD
ncbi:DUF6090 family protein [Chryseobacterium sp.]|uniref:DUF6090 family protein n=1 Tax=Chryseobacterium sp. TaxID=1871047 RepID=UPI00388DBEE3